MLHRLKYLILPLSLLLTGTVQAEPLTLLMSMAALQSTFSDEEQGTREPHKTLSAAQQDPLAQLPQHPVISACLATADRGDPVAAYHVYKLGQYAQSLHHPAEGQNSPDPARVSKAYRWCAQQAGIEEQDIALSQSGFRAMLLAAGERHDTLKLARADSVD